MLMQRWFASSLVLTLALGLAACQSTDQSPAVSSGGAGDVPAVGAGAGASDSGAVGAPTAAPGDQASPSPAQPMVASGQATLPPAVQVTEQPRPQPEEGIQRAVSLEEAKAAVPFPFLSAVMPETADLTMVQLIEAPEGTSVSGLPAVRTIYDLEGALLVVYQSPATGEPAEGEPVSVGAHSGNIQESDQVTILTWEQDGVRVVLRVTDLDREALVKLAATMSAAPE